MGKKIKEIKVSDIKNPEFLHDLNYKELELLAQNIRIELIDKISKTGGHLSSNLGIVELTMALHRNFDFKEDKLLFDVGHQSYVHKILTGRSLENLRTENGVSGFIKKSESPYDVFEAGHSSTSISAAQGFAVANRINDKKQNVVCLVGDGSLYNGVSFEGLFNLSILRDSKVIVIFNDNGMAIAPNISIKKSPLRKLQTSSLYDSSRNRFKSLLSKHKLTLSIYNFFRKVKNFFVRHLISPTIFDQFDLAYIGPIDGHDFKELDKALKRAKNYSRSVVIHCKTIKGKGYSFTENDTEGKFHGVNAFNPNEGPKDSTDLTFSKYFSNLIEDKLVASKNNVLINPSMIYGCSQNELLKKYPKQVFDEGIAEEHSLIFASGLAQNNVHPIVSIYSTFLQRGFDQIIHDLLRIKSNATILIERAGLVGGDGETHEGIYDESFLINLPGNPIISIPSNMENAKDLFDASFNNDGTYFIRLPRTKINDKMVGNVEKSQNKFHYEIYNKSNSKKCVLVFGPLGENLAKTLIDEGKLDALIINPLYINPIDDDLLNLLLEQNSIYIYNPYSTENGFIQKLIFKLNQKSYKGKVSYSAVPNEFIQHGTISYQLNKCELDLETVKGKIYQFFK